MDTLSGRAPQGSVMKKIRQGLSRLEEKLLSHIAHHVIDHGYQPSYREIAEAWGYTSPGYIRTLISKLQDRGVVKSMGARAVAFDYPTFLETFRT